MASTLNKSQSDLHEPTLSRADSESLIPAIVQLDTPGESSLSHYQPSEYSDFGEDELDIFYGTNFDEDGGLPSFLNDASLPQPVAADVDNAHSATEPAQNATPATAAAAPTYPLTPAQTASIYTASPAVNSAGHQTRTSLSEGVPVTASISPQQLHAPFQTPGVNQFTQLTPNETHSGRSSFEGLAPAPPVMRAQSPRVMVSHFEYNGGQPVQSMERVLYDGAPPSPAQPNAAAGNVLASTEDDRYRRGGVAPADRTADEAHHRVNDLALRHEADEAVGSWLGGERPDVNFPVDAAADAPADAMRALNQKEADEFVQFGKQTENRHKPGLYFNAQGGPLTARDEEMFRAEHVWGDAPRVHGISNTTRYQPETAAAAMARLEFDNNSMISRQATWGTRRLSLPSVIDAEGVVSGSLFKKLAISIGDKTSNKHNLFQEIKQRVRRPSTSALRKRSRSAHRDTGDSSERNSSQDEPRRDSLGNLSPVSRTSSWGKKAPKATPSISNAIMAMSTNMASVGGGSGHYRSNSISRAVPLAAPQPSPKSGGIFSNLSVPQGMRRRAKSSPSLVTTPIPAPAAWTPEAAPPSRNPSQRSMNRAADDDDDDEDDEDGGSVNATAHTIDGIEPTILGFQQHVLDLNPGLGTDEGKYLVERIAWQQNRRYKRLMNARVAHLQPGATCKSGSLCVSLGGQAVPLVDEKNKNKTGVPPSLVFDDDEIAPESRLIQDNFPADIPMPGAVAFPAKFECHLCFEPRSCKKPSDWTKHVHEDVAPFTCTWPNCREAKEFKRKADWVRHENEGHRQLERWTCDVDECTHVCFRRDNFSQHLQREHKDKYPEEPKSKGKTSKKAATNDQLAQKVEQCRMETNKLPQDEPCRFCGRSFPSWKKLTVHLAKHMEQIALPVLRLVEANTKHLTADTIISPLVEQPRNSIPSPIHGVMPPDGFNAMAPQQMHNQQMSGFVQQPGFGYGAPNGMAMPVYNSINQQMVPQMNRFAPPMGNNFPNSNAGYMQSIDAHMPMVTVADGLGMGSMQGAGPLSFDNTMLEAPGVNSVTGSPFSGQESLSRYSHSPNLNPTIPQQDQLNMEWIQQQQQRQQQQNQQHQQNHHQQGYY